MKQLIRQFLPVELIACGVPLSDKRLMTSFAMQRSGQHLIIEWVCRGLPAGVLHFNHCRFIKGGRRLFLKPIMGRRIVYSGDTVEDSGAQGTANLCKDFPVPAPEYFLYSVEDMDPLQRSYRRLIRKYSPEVILILRDPANWLASSIRHGRKEESELREHMETYKKQLSIATGQHRHTFPRVIVFNYNEFIINEAYRRDMAGKFDQFDLDKADVALARTPDFGGGSSFSGLSKSQTNDRWRKYENDTFFRSLLADRELLELSKAFFGEIGELSILEELTRRK